MQIVNLVVIKLNNFMEYQDDSLDEVADSIIDQLKNQGQNLKNIEKDYPELSPEDVDSFILKYGSKAVIDLADVLKEQADLVKQTGDEKQVLALAELAKSFQGNLEVLQKRSIANNKNDTAVKIKQMDIDSKKESQEHEEMTRLTMSREELFKIMIQQTADIKKENNKVIDI